MTTYTFVPRDLPPDIFPPAADISRARRRVFLKRALRRVGFPVDPEATTPVLVRCYFRFVALRSTPDTRP